VSAARELPWGAGHDLLREKAVAAIADRIAQRREPLAHQVLERFRGEVSDGASDPELEAEQYTFTLENIDAFVAMLRGAEPLTSSWSAVIREASARRVHLRVSLEFFLHAARVWGEVLWEAVMASAALDRPAEREGAIQIAACLMRQVDILSRVAMNAYLDEITDRGLLRRDLLDALVTGRGEAPAVQAQARALHLTLAESYIVVVLRDAEMHGEVGQSEPLASRVALDRMVAGARSRVQPPASAGSLLTGVREGDVVVLYPVSDPGAELEVVRQDCLELARQLPPDLSIGLSGVHRGLRAIATAYAEARDAATLAGRLGIHGRPVGVDELLVDHMLQGSAHAQRILDAVVRPLCDYDREHGSELVATLAAYVRTHFNLTRSAELLTVHPNTVVYRLRRIGELSGRDPQDVDDLIVLALALKVHTLHAGVDLAERRASRPG
jgi:sugar diacid utilization regulator